MPDWLIGFLGGLPVGGVLIYFLKGWIDDVLRSGAEKRGVRTEERKKRYELLLELLGDPQSHFTWLLEIPSARLSEGEPPASAKVQMIPSWIYRHRARFPEDVQAPLNRILG